MGGERAGRPGEAVGQLRPRMGRRRHLGQRAEREAAAALDHHAGGPRPRRLERDAVLGRGGYRPKLLAPSKRQTAAVAEVDQAVPVTFLAQAVDLPRQLVEVAALDELLVHTIGHGYGRLEPGSGKRPSRSTAAARFCNASRSDFDSSAANSAGSPPGAASRSTSASRAAGTGSPLKSQITVRSLGSSWKQRPWSIPQMCPSSVSRQWPDLRSALLANRSNVHIARSASWWTGSSSSVK